MMFKEMIQELLGKISQEIKGTKNALHQVIDSSMCCGTGLSIHDADISYNSTHSHNSLKDKQF